MLNPEVKGQPGNSLQNAYIVFKKQELLEPQVGLWNFSFNKT